jgi:hypothetical protein
MDAHEIARRASVLPDRFATRVSAQTLADLRLMAEGGEHGELTSELTAALAASGAEVSADEQRELFALLAATGMPTEPADGLAVRG